MRHEKVPGRFPVTVAAPPRKQLATPSPAHGNVALGLPRIPWLVSKIDIAGSDCFANVQARLKDKHKDWPAVPAPDHLTMRRPDVDKRQHWYCILSVRSKLRPPRTLLLSLLLSLLSRADRVVRPYRNIPKSHAAKPDFGTGNTPMLHKHLRGASTQATFLRSSWLISLDRNRTTEFAWLTTAPRKIRVVSARPPPSLAIMIEAAAKSPLHHTLEITAGDVISNQR